MTFLRNLFGRRTDAATAVSEPPPAPVPVVPARPQPVPEPEAPAMPAEDSVTMSLKAITDLFPEDLKPALHKQPSEHVRIQIPRALIQPQLAAGAIRITFAQLRAATPEIFFNANAASGDARLLLPLDQVLSQLAPSRREDQRQPAIPVYCWTGVVHRRAGAGP